MFDAPCLSMISMNEWWMLYKIEKQNTNTIRGLQSAVKPLSQSRDNSLYVPATPLDVMSNAIRLIATPDNTWETTVKAGDCKEMVVKLVETTVPSAWESCLLPACTFVVEMCPFQHLATKEDQINTMSLEQGIWSLLSCFVPSCTAKYHGYRTHNEHKRS